MNRRIARFVVGLSLSLLTTPAAGKGRGKPRIAAAVARSAAARPAVKAQPRSDASKGDERPTLGTGESTEAGEAALEAVKERLARLKADPRRRIYRSHWLDIAQKFEQVEKRFAATPEGPRALFNAGNLYSDLARISWSESDVATAAHCFERLASTYPRSSLADDALMELARIRTHRQNDPSGARTALQQLLTDHARGDMAAQARSLLAQLPKATAAEKAAEKAIEKAAEKAPERTVESPRAAPVVASAPAARREAGSEGGVPRADERAALAARIQAASPRLAEPAPAHRPSSPGRTPIVDAAAIEAAGMVATAPVAASPEPVVAVAAPAAPARAAVPVVPAGEPTGEEAESDELPVLAESHPHPYDDEPPAKPSKAQLAQLAQVVRRSRDLTLSAQMGLKVKKVVIDPGHGGHDTGAIGPTGLREKDVALAVSRRLAERLRKQGLEVVLTRGEDKFVPLEGRTRFANAQHADLFVSVHCNAAASRSLRGTETYSLNVGSDRFATRLAARENATTERSLGELQFLLADLATRANTADSRRLASLVQGSLVQGLKGPEPIRDLGTKEALFYVLMGARMPAILVETAFLSNPHDEKRLADPEYQEKLAGSIAAGLEKFIGERSALALAPAVEQP